MKNTISHRVADFLKNFPPFNFLQQKEIETLSEQISIIYKEKDSVVFAENEETHSSFYVVHKGAVALRKGEKNDVLDMCDEGDIFGLRPLIANENYKMEARTYEEPVILTLKVIAGNYMVKQQVANY